ncbi:MFS transporter [Sphingomonas canadensis]|uniref:MFS transporter n=1 Tax=Sphingomonas canadensis TaxID=1219257 RepID=A0ABW3HAB1_9SPHN|nr:MFS transporter [Sphingomonas canadensis]MCW3836763.1 MFS transporter [Sphingomonas canadensis]
MTFHHRAVPIVLTAVLIDSIGFGIVLPVLPRLIVELGHVTMADAARIGGYMLAAYSVMQLIAAPILGNLGDALGRRPVLLFSMIAFSADYALQAAAPSIAWLFLGRMIAGIAGASFGPANAVLADVTPPDRRAATFGMMGAAFGIGFILGPALGGALSLLGPRAPFVAAAAAALLNALWIYFFLPETLAPERRRRFDWRKAHIIGSFEPLRHAGRAKWLIAVAFLWYCGHMVYPATWAFWGELAAGWDERMIGLSLAASGLSMALVQTFVTSRAIRRFGEERTVVLGLVAGGLAFVAYVFVRQTWIIYLILAFSAFQALVSPSVNALLSRYTSASHQGSLMGGLAALNSVAAALSPFALSQALAFGAERGFTGGNFVVAAALTAMALAIVLLRVLPGARREPGETAGDQPS